MNELAVNELTEAEQQFLYNSGVLKMTHPRRRACCADSDALSSQKQYTYGAK